MQQRAQCSLSRIAYRQVVISGGGVFQRQPGCQRQGRIRPVQQSLQLFHRLKPVGFPVAAQAGAQSFGQLCGFGRARAAGNVQLAVLVIYKSARRLLVGVVAHFAVSVIKPLIQLHQSVPAPIGVAGFQPFSQEMREQRKRQAFYSLLAFQGILHRIRCREYSPPVALKGRFGQGGGVAFASFWKAPLWQQSIISYWRLERLRSSSSLKKSVESAVAESRSLSVSTVARNNRPASSKMPWP